MRIRIELHEAASMREHVLEEDVDEVWIDYGSGAVLNKDENLAALVALLDRLYGEMRQSVVGRMSPNASAVIPCVTYGGNHAAAKEGE